MKPLFYLSCSHTDDDYSLIRKFYFDLCDSIKIKASPPFSQPVGFLDMNDSWNNDAIEAIQNCTAFIALLSPSYIASVRAGQEWQVMESRRQRQLPHLQYQRMRKFASEGALVPINWVPVAAPLPTPIKDELTYAKFTYSIPTEGLQATLKSRGSFGPIYTRIVNELAKYLLELSKDISLLAGDILPTQIKPAFGGNMLVQTKRASESHNVWILEDDEFVRGMLEEHLLLSGYSVKAFDEAEAIEDETNSDLLHTMPDLFIVDLELKEKRTQGLDFIEKITARTSAPPVIAITGRLPPEDLVRAMESGAWATFAKPLNLLEVHKKVKKLSVIGRKKRDFKRGQFDTDRLQRPVFLSYQEQDRKKAGCLRNQIEAQDMGVWYAPEAVPPGSKWREEVRKGIDEAEVFVAFLTDNYSHSGPCIAELLKFNERLSPESDSPVLLPVVYNLSRSARNDPTIKQFLSTHHFIEMSDEDFINPLTELLGRLQTLILPFG